jgi:DUF4097 and DUF4098 domain-containing protein YvlB
MILTLALGLATAALPNDTTLTVDVRRGQRLDVQAHNGRVTIHTWAREEVRIQSTGRSLPEIASAGSVLHIDNGPGRRRDGEDDLTLIIPAAMDIRVDAVGGDVVVENAGGAVEVQSVEGEVNVSGGRGIIILHSVSGGISVTGARGKIDLNTVSEGIKGSDLEGTITAETVSDEIRLTGIRSDDVSATSVSGDMTYEGTMAPAGRYHFSSHSGDCIIEVPAGVRADLDISTYSGDFESDFPVTVSDRRGKRFTASVGGGGAKVALESFSGSIHLVRAGTRGNR